MPTIHLIAPFHTVPTLAASHCAFTQKAFRFSKMMHLIPQEAGGATAEYKIIEYANEGSESHADEKVPMLSKDEYAVHYKPETVSPGAQGSKGTSGYNLFCARLELALRKRAKMGDIVAHVFGPEAHVDIVRKFPGLIHVESGIGNPWTPMGAYPIFESEAWRNYQWGRYGNPGGVVDGKGFTPGRTWVIPNYFDVADWPLSTSPENVVGFMSRFVVDKGIEMLANVIKAWDEKHPDDDTQFHLAGMGDYNAWFVGANFTERQRARITYLGAVVGADRAKLLGSCKAFLLPTIFVEPFGGAAVEAMLCGTPVCVPTFGAFVETVHDGVTGFRCRGVDDYVSAIENAAGRNRSMVRGLTADRYSLEAVAPLYDAAFKELLSRPYVE